MLRQNGYITVIPETKINKFTFLSPCTHSSPNKNAPEGVTKPFRNKLHQFYSNQVSEVGHRRILHTILNKA